MARLRHSRAKFSVLWLDSAFGNQDSASIAAHFADMLSRNPGNGPGNLWGPLENPGNPRGPQGNPGTPGDPRGP